MLSAVFGSGFVPHGICLLWEPALLWLHALSDLATGVAYYAIPVELAWLVIQRRDLAFSWIFWLFALFILACGTTHFMDVWVLWHPDYGIQGLLKGFTALASILTASLFWMALPRLLALPTPAQFQRVNSQLSDETVRHEQTVEQLRRSEESFRLLVESIRDCAMYLLDTSGHVTTWNAGATRIKQYEASEIIGRHFECFFTATDRAAGKPADILEIAARVGSYQEEGWRVRRDGSLFMADTVVNPILDRDDKLVGFVKITRDITQRRQAQQELEQARAALAQSQKMEAVGQLTGGIAHDFNNMLTAILGSVELLESKQQSLTPTANRMLNVIRHASERGAELTGRLLAFSRKQSLTPSIIDASALVAGMSELLRRTLGQSITIETALASDLWPAVADANQVESALLNLAVNARDAMADGGTLTIETANVFLDEDYARRHDEVKPGEYVMISVSDTGTGMPPDVLEHVFEPFYTTKEIGRGTGLGLSQVYGFVKQSGGEVEVHSTLGIGTTVRMYLPRPEPTYKPDRPAATVSSDPIPVGTETVLVVEDDVDVRGYSLGALRHLGYNALEAASSAAALAILDARPDIRLLFTDVGLPGTDGQALAAAAQATRPDLKVVFTSGYARTAIANLGLLEAGVLLLPKPFRIDSLARILRTALDAK